MVGLGCYYKTMSFSLLFLCFCTRVDKNVLLGMHDFCKVTFEELLRTRALFCYTVNLGLVLLLLDKFELSLYLCSPFSITFGVSTIPCWLIVAHVLGDN